MSIFGNIVSAIFGPAVAAAETIAKKAATAAAPSTTSAAPSSGSTAAPKAAAPAGTTAAATPAKPMTRQEVEAAIAKRADDADEDLDWKQSIVDLMKVLKLDSSLGARKQLAQELGYTGALDGSAQMNVWLHKQVMQKLAETGGQVPDSLRHA
jgi:3-oxoacyl-ACP reductase-like protein